MEDDATISHPPSVEFYDFVGFREAISPALHDAVKQFALDRGLTINQLNRRALADFIQRPELASDLLITSVAAMPQSVNEKTNQDGSNPLPERDQVEMSTFRFTLFNSSHDWIDVSKATYLPESIENRSYDTVAKDQHPSLNHEGHIAVSLSGLKIGKTVHMDLDLSTKDFIVWFHDQSKPRFVKIRGRLMVGEVGNIAMSEFFTITLHGDSPSPDF
jgi:hypothetical protein